jgi:hypothetical protein
MQRQAAIINPRNLLVAMAVWNQAKNAMTATRLPAMAVQPTARENRVAMGRSIQPRMNNATMGILKTMMAVPRPVNWN